MSISDYKGVSLIPITLSGISASGSSLIGNTSSVAGTVQSISLGDGVFFSGNSLAVSGNVIDVRTFGAKPDAKTVSDIRTTTGGATVTSAAGLFTANDVGKSIKIYDIQNETAVFRGTISSITNSTVAILSAVATYSSASGNAIAYWGTDNSIAIQAALNAASALVPRNYNGPNFPVGSGVAKVVFPTDTSGAGYVFNSSLTVGRNVSIDANAMLFSNVGIGITDRTYPLSGTGYHIENAVMEVGGGMGPTIGDALINSCSWIKNLQVWNVGSSFSGSLTPNSQTALHLTGYDFYIGRFWSKGGNVGVHIDSASDVVCAAAMEIIAATTGVQFTGGENLDINWINDTGSLIAGAIDGTRNSNIKCRAFSVTATALTKGLQIGGYSTTTNCGLKIDFTGQNCGGKGVTVGYSTDITINSLLTNSPLYSASGSAITLGVEYTTGNTGSVVITQNRDGAIASAYSGTVVGTLYDISDGFVRLHTTSNIWTST